MSYNDTPHDEVETFSKITPELFSSQSSAGYLAEMRQDMRPTTDRFCSTFALLPISMNMHKSRRYGDRWRAGMCAALSRSSPFCMKTERGHLKARIR